jgi:ribosomal protein S20
MPIIKSAIKRMHQTLKRRARNVSSKRNLRTAVKAFDAEKSADSLSKAQSEIDKAVKKNLMSKNTAARKKAQLSKQAKDSGIKLKATPAKKAAAKKETAPKTETKKAAPTKTTTKKSAEK